MENSLETCKLFHSMSPPPPSSLSNKRVSCNDFAEEFNGREESVELVFQLFIGRGRMDHNQGEKINEIVGRNASLSS